MSKHEQADRRAEGGEEKERGDVSHGWHITHHRHPSSCPVEVQNRTKHQSAQEESAKQHNRGEEKKEEKRKEKGREGKESSWYREQEKKTVSDGHNMSRGRLQ